MDTMYYCSGLDGELGKRDICEVWKWPGGRSHASYDWRIPVKAMVEDIVNDNMEEAK